MACPLASGVAALVLSRNANLTAGELRNILRRSADKIGPLAYNYVGPDPNDTRNDFYGYGRINAGRAVQMTPADTAPPTFIAAASISRRYILAVFSEPMGNGVLSPSSYTFSGTGLSANPNRIERVSIYEYRL